MDSNDKWVWGEGTDSSPSTPPLLDQKLKPIAEWPDVQADPPVPAVIAEPSDSKASHSKASDSKVEEVPAPVPVPASRGLGRFRG